MPIDMDVCRRQSKLPEKLDHQFYSTVIDKQQNLFFIQI